MFSDKDEKLQKIYNWLSAPDHQSKHAIARKERRETTGEWFVQGKFFQGWMISSNSFLWLHGMRTLSIAFPANKYSPLRDYHSRRRQNDPMVMHHISISWLMWTHACVSSTIIEEITHHCKQRSLLAVAYFYFEFHNKNVHPDVILRSLIKQLSLQCASTPDVLENIFSENANGHRSPTSEELISTLKSIIECFKNVYLVFDALDECQGRREFLTLLQTFRYWEIGAIHLLATSRHEQDIAKVLTGLVSYSVPMDEKFVDSDIRFHVSTTLNDDPAFGMYSAEERKMVETVLTEGAHGM